MFRARSQEGTPAVFNGALYSITVDGNAPIPYAPAK
jgi:hypothetical protein